MSAEPSQVELLVPADERLTAAVDVVVANACERAGLSHEEEKELVRATADVCDEVFRSARRMRRSGSLVRVLVSDFPNRVEVSIEESDGGPDDGGPDGPRPEALTTPAREADAITAALHHISVDRLHYEIRDGRARTTIVKYHAGTKPQGTR